MVTICSRFGIATKKLYEPLHSMARQRSLSRDAREQMLKSIVDHKKQSLGETPIGETPIIETQAEIEMPQPLSMTNLNHITLRSSPLGTSSFSEATSKPNTRSYSTIRRGPETPRGFPRLINQYGHGQQGWQQPYDYGYNYHAQRHRRLTHKKNRMSSKASPLTPDDDPRNKKW